MVDDEELRRGFSERWYISRISDALQKLALETYYSKVTLDFDFPSDSHALAMPKNVFNPREIYLYKGACCAPETSQVVHWKRLFNNKNGGEGKGYTARIKETGSQATTDPFLPKHYNHLTGNNYYYNIQNGIIMFSSTCASFPKIRIVFNTLGGEVGTMPIIPRFLEEAVKDYVIMKFYEAMKGRQPRKYRTLWADKKDEFSNLRDGSLKNARMHVSSMNTADKESMEEYMGSIFHR